MNYKSSLLMLLFCLVAAASMAQYNYRNRPVDQDEDYGSYLKFGTQVPLQHSVMYDHRITPTFSINAGLGFLVAPYPNMIFNGLENRGVIKANDKRIMQDSYQSGISYQLGANFHFQKNYVRVFGQLAHLNADLPITDLASLYFGTNIPPVVGGIASFLNPIDIKSNVTMAGLLYGRRFVLGPNAEIHAELSLAKTVSHQTNYRTGTIIDNIEVVNDIIYNELDNDLNTYFSEYGWFPTFNVYYVYKF